MSDTIRSETLMEDYNKMLRENIKLKEHIKELEAEIVVVKSQKMREFMSGADAELAKRDQLIEQASSLWIRALVRSPWETCKAWMWLKEVDELKI